MLTRGIQSQTDHSMREVRRLHAIRHKLKESSQSTLAPAVATYFKFPSSVPNLANLISLSRGHLTELNGGQWTLNPSIDTLHQVYKLVFTNGATTGFGDFVRGCYFVLQFADKHGLRADFHMVDSALKLFLPFFREKPALAPLVAHNIAKCNPINVEFTKTYKGIIDYKMMPNGEESFIRYVHTQPVYGGTNAFVNTVMFPTHAISSQHVERMRHMLEPTTDLQSEVSQWQEMLGLPSQGFDVYHIRMGDTYLDYPEDSRLQPPLLQKLFAHLAFQPRQKCLVLSDSMVLKRLIQSKFPEVATLQFERACRHSTVNDEQSIRQTLIEFYLMSHARSIVSFSVYPHGTGFSKWCAVTYGIPYVCFHI